MIGIRILLLRKLYWGTIITESRELIMSEREQAMMLLRAVPDYKIKYAIAYLEGIIAGEDIPNDETLAAFAEVEEMKRTGSGERFDNLDDLWANLEA